MPTATAFSGYSLSNNGPLTTTFTAPASCTTAFVMVGFATNPAYVQWDAQCDWLPPADCNPSGSAIRSIISAENNIPTAADVIVYHSPGLICPSGWEIVGSAAKPNPTSTSISGAFNQSAAVLNVFLAVLDPGETAVLCRPRSATLPSNQLMLSLYK
jgi:hypothetical protein